MASQLTWDKLPSALQQFLESVYYSAGTHFAAWNTMSKEQRVKCVEDVGYPTGFAKQWAERDFKALPADIKAGLLANGYFKQFVAEQSPVQFGSRREAQAEWNSASKNTRRSMLMEFDAGNIDELVDQKWGELPDEVQAELAKQFVASDATKFSAHFQGFSEAVTAASELLKSGAAESDVRAALKQMGITDENQQREILAAARSYEAREGKTFAAMDAAKWNGLPPKTKDAELRAIGLRNAPEFAFADWDELDDEIQKALQTGGKVHGYSANSDTMKPGGKFSAKFAAQEPIRPGDKVADDWERSGIAVATKIENGKRMVEVRWEGRSSTSWEEEALLWRKGRGQQTSFSASLPTDDESKPEVKSFSTAVEAVNYLADNGFVNDRSRALARVEATGKWSAPSGACVERFAGAQSDPRGYTKARWDGDKHQRNRISWLKLVGVSSPFDVAEVLEKEWDQLPSSLQDRLIAKVSTGSTTPD